MNYHVEAWDILQHLFKVKKINDHVLHFAAEFSSELNFVWVKQAVDLLADAFPLIRCGFEEAHYHRPIWVDKGHTSDDMVALLETEDSSQAVQRFLCQEIDLRKGPQIKIGIIRNGKNDTICILINHMLCDAAGFKEILYTLGSAYTGFEKQTEIQIDSLIRDRSVGQILKKHSLKERMKIYRSKNQINPHGNQKFNFEGDLSNPFIETKKIPREQFLLLNDYAKSHHASINDIMMAAFLRVLFHSLGYAGPLPCAIDLRRFLPNHRARGICNLMSNLCCYIGPDLGAGFESTLLKVKKEMDVQKNDLGSIRDIALLEKLFALCPYRIASTLLKKYFSNPPVAFTNIGILDKNKLVFGNSIINDAYMTGSIKYIPNFQLSLTTFNDKATLCVNLYGTQKDRQIVIDFLNDFALELQNEIIGSFQT